MADAPVNFYCCECEYNLRGLTGNSCPECGCEFDRDDPGSYLEYIKPLLQRNPIIWFVLCWNGFGFSILGPWSLTLGVMSFHKTIDGLMLNGEPVETLSQKAICTIGDLVISILGFLFVFYWRHLKWLRLESTMLEAEPSVTPIKFNVIMNDMITALMAGLAGVTFMSCILTSDVLAFTDAWLMGVIALIPIGLWSIIFHFYCKKRLIAVIFWIVVSVCTSSLMIIGLQDCPGADIAMFFINLTLAIGTIIFLISIMRR